MSLSHVKAYKGIGMEGPIATWYAKNTRRDIAEFRSLAARVSQEIVPGSRILEVAPGPGYLSIELARRGQYEVTGLDIRILRRDRQEECCQGVHVRRFSTRQCIRDAFRGQYV
jgi:ubiquinone/menaquinone biosynthesis C-methylase UbiE